MECTLQSSKMSQKDSDKEQTMLPIDQLSSLPDEVISHILSFLPVKLSVATSILSRRWRFLWAHVPNLYFDTDDHHSRMRFSSIVNNVMLLHKMQRLTTFRFGYLDFNTTEYDLKTWVSLAIERKVQNLQLDLDLVDKLPQSIFSCRTLVELSLHNCTGIPARDAICLPNLKKLDLFTLEYEVDEDLPNLLSACPVLEELIVRWIVDRDWGCCCITSSTIKRLTIEFPIDEFEFYNPYDTVKITAPALRYLEVVNCSYDHISLAPMPYLIEAVLGVNIYMFELDYQLYTRCVLRFIDSLSHVKYLKLSGISEEFPDLGVACQYVRFDNLTKLELMADWRFIPKFLESADNLEVLTIHEVDEHLKNWMEPIEKQRPCLLFSLRTIIIDEFGCTQQELNMIKYLLRTARVLKRMEICCQCDYDISLEAKFYALQKISLFRRGSRDCEIAFS